MRRIPEYFERVRDNAERTWNQLTDNPELAGPWHQLFKQIQIPRHVVSELLQNADDAGAKTARIEIANDIFIFSHDGRDFVESDFTSLCRFGYSNKRALHTIGFRGIGFKSTFSIGDLVELKSPTLSVLFHSERFTEPVWVDDRAPVNRWTSVQVRIRDSHVRKELEGNLREWIDSPASLLFLRSLQNLTIQDKAIRWWSSRVGPVPHSEWIAVSSAPGHEYLHLRSGEEPFPDEALVEISSERIAGDVDLDFPPCSVEIVLGMHGDIYVVLPTTVRTGLPFAVNAPFIQDPGRSKLKEPEISYTNRWLLGRVGRLAAESMVKWIGQSDLGMEERCRAYGLMLESPEEDGTLESRCQGIVYDAFSEALGERPFLLIEEGALVRAGNAVAVPPGLLDVWSSREVATIFLSAEQSVLVRNVADEDATKLEQAKCIEILDDVDVLRILKTKRPPRPNTWDKLLALWHLSAENLLASREHIRRTDAKIVPVLRSDYLHAAYDVVRVGRRITVELGEEWQFIAQRLLALDPGWVDFIALLGNQEPTREAGDEAREVLDVLGLGYATDAAHIVDHVAQSIFSEDEVALDDAVRIAHIAARLDVSASESMRFFTGDDQIRSTDENLVADLFGDLDLFVDSDWMKQRVLHYNYQARFESCAVHEWRSWILSGKSRLLPFVPIEKRLDEFHGRARFEEVMAAYGVEDDLPENSYARSDKYGLRNWDFPEELLELWKERVQQDPRFWSRLLDRFLHCASWVWEASLRAIPVFIAFIGSGQREIHDVVVPSAWIVRLRGLPCLEDTRGNIHLPSELLLRTAETEALLDVEPFVRADLDTDETRPLLVSLGVRQTSTDASGLVGRLRALAMAPEPPVRDVLKLYEHLDRLTEHLPTEQMDELQSLFQRERLILVEGGGWVTTNGAFLTCNEASLRGVAIVHSLTRDLSLWRRLGVADQPTVEAVLDWLRELPVGVKLPADQRCTVQRVLGSVAARGWTECGRWLNLEGEWMMVDDLRYALAETRFAVEGELFPAIRRQTADLRFLSVDTLMREPFAAIPSLAGLIERRVGDAHQLVGTPQRKPWVVAMAHGLQRLQLDEEQEQQRIRREADHLSSTVWQTVRGPLEIVPFVDGTPVGTPQEVDAVWYRTEFLVTDRSAARLATPIVEEMGRPFTRSDLLDAFRTCYERTPGFVAEYLEEVFELDSELEEAPMGVPVATICGNVGADNRASEQVQSSRPEDLPAHEAEFAAADEVFEPGSELEEVPTGVRVATIRDNVDVDDHASEQVQSSGPEDLPVHEAEFTATDLIIEQASGDPEQATESSEASAPRRSGSERPVLMERFLHTRGYLVDGTSHRFVRASGGWAEKGDAGLWEEYDASGDLRQCYWAKEHCLERGPLNLPAEIWELCKQYPDVYSLILTDTTGEPDQYDGKRLEELRRAGKLKLHAAEYRLEIS